MNLTETIPDLLLACLRQTPPADLASQLAQLSPEAWTELLTIATEQNVPSLLYQRLKNHGYESLVPVTTWQALHKKYYGIALRNMRLYQELDKLIDALDAQGITSLVLKGAHLAANVYETIALRNMVDIDIMVHQKDLSTAIQQVQALGYRPITPILALETYLDYKHHLPPFVRPNTVASVEIHWTITGSIRTYAIPVEKLWERSRAVTLTETKTRGFCPEDLLLHVCMHATYHHQLRQGVRFLCDIAEIVQHYADELDWEAVIARAVAWNWQRGVFLALYATQALLGTKLPEQVLHRLNPTTRTQPDLQTLQAMLFPTDRTLVNTSSPNFFNLVTTPQLSDKLRLIQQGLFLPRKLLAVAYNVAPQSPWLPLYYFVRLKDLLGRNMHKTWRAWQGDQTIILAAGRQEQLQQWLEQR